MSADENRPDGAESPFADEDAHDQAGGKPADWSQLHYGEVGRSTEQQPTTDHTKSSG